MDRATKKKSKIDYARILGEVQITTHILEYMEFRSESGVLLRKKFNLSANLQSLSFVACLVIRRMFVVGKQN